MVFTLWHSRVDSTSPDTAKLFWIDPAVASANRLGLVSLGCLWEAPTELELPEVAPDSAWWGFVFSILVKPYEFPKFLFF